MQKNMWIIVGVGILVIVALFAWNRFSNNTISDGTGVDTVPPVSETDKAKGNHDASVILIEYSDFECPACGAYYQPVKQLAEEYGDRVLFVYRHFPLTKTHRNALAASFAAEAAGRQGKFFEMHDLLFENQQAWSDSEDAATIFLGFAESLELNIVQFTNDTNDKTILDHIEASYRDGLRAGVNGTPTFFLNGKKIENPRSYEAFREVINLALQTE